MAARNIVRHDGRGGRMARGSHRPTVAIPAACPAVTRGLHPWSTLRSPRRTGSSATPPARSPRPRSCPHIREWDEKGEVHREVFAKMAELGFLGAPIPERYGGAGMDYVSFALLCEELERADTAFRVVQSRPRRAQLADAPAVGDRGAEAALARAPGARREARDVRAHRAGRRDGRGLARVDRAARRRLVRPQRAQDLDLAGRHRGPLPRVRLGRPRRRSTRASRRSWSSGGCPA